MNPARLRIAIFSDSALPILNGVSISVDLLVRGLRDAGHSVHVYTAGFPRHRDPDPNTYRFRAIHTPWTQGYPVAIPPFVGMLRQFRRHEYDVVHTHTPFTVGFVGLRWAESHDIPIVSTYHTLYDRYAHYIPYFPRRYTRFKIAKHTNFYYNSVRRVIVPGRAAERWLRRHAVETPITIIPTAAPPRAMLERSEVRRSLGILPEQRALLYVGRVAKEKNLELLFEAVARVFAQEENARLILVGDGPYRETCRQVVREHGIGDRVTFAGFVPREEVDRYYAAADLFVFSSVTETQGLVVQEAMTYGLPAVVATGGGAGESIVDGENGFIVAAEAGALSATILEVLRNDSLHAKLSENARRSVRLRSIEAMVNAVLQVYREAIAAPNPIEAPEADVART